MRRLLVVPLAAALAGCLSIDWDGRKNGTPIPILDSHRLKVGETTLRETLALLGPPELILRVGEVDRAYYVAWSSDYVKFVASIPLPIGGRRSLDMFILGFGGEELRLARLEFDRTGVLRDLQRLDTAISRDGEYVALDNRIVEGFLEDRARVLNILEADRDDDDLDEEARRRKSPK